MSAHPGKSKSARTARYYTRTELAALLSEQYGFPVTRNRLDKEGHYGTGPEPAGKFGQRLLYTEESGLAWARKRFRSRASGRASV
jgi:hypothetical protein